MPSTIKTLKNTTYDTVRTSSFTKIHGRLTQSDYENLKKEAADLASKLDDITYAWSRCPIGQEFGLLAEIIGKDEYLYLTGLTWVQESKPATYDPNTNDTTATHTALRMGTHTRNMGNQKRFPPRSRSKFPRCPGQKLVLPAQRCPHRLPQHNPHPNP